MFDDDVDGGEYGGNMKYDLYHYYENERGPFKNLSSLNMEEARKVQENLKRSGDVFASRRADDYLDVRRGLESKARDLFIRKGGMPRTEYPHYMTLGECPWIKSWYRDGREIKINLDEFDPLCISFTYGDLFPTMRVEDGKAYRGQVYTISEILGLIGELGFPQAWNPEGTLGPERYIEAQIWDERVIGKYQ